MKKQLLLSAMVLGCSPEQTAPPSGVELPEGPCGRGVFVASSDYQSTSIAILDWEGELAAASILSSGSEQTGLSAPLSGDVVAPTARTSSGKLVLIDRSQAVITILDPVTASVEQQITVGTGFAANPQDVLETGGELLVSRYGQNPEPGREPFDEGGDLLVVAGDGTLEARIDLDAAMAGAADGILPRPSRLSPVGGHVAVLLSAYSRDFSSSDDGRVALVDPERREVVSFARAEGLRGCSALAVSPSTTQIAVGCSGTFAGSSTPSLEDSGVMVFALGSDASLTESWRLSAAELGGDPVSFSIAFAGEDRLLTTTFGRLGDDAAQERPDRLLLVDLETSSVSELARTDKTPFSLGDVRCAQGCGVCFAADAERRGVHRIDLDGVDVALELFGIDDGIGLPPRYLGAY